MGLSRFLSTLSLRRATHNLVSDFGVKVFLSTLSLRRATVIFKLSGQMEKNFYPRSPCGERRAGRCPDPQSAWISIHALLAESDVRFYRDRAGGEIFLSTLSLRRATRKWTRSTSPSIYFYPRSPCGERRGQMEKKRSSENFYPRSPCGERRADPRHCTRPRYFYPRSPCGERLRRSLP